MKLGKFGDLHDERRADRPHDMDKVCGLRVGRTVADTWDLQLGTAMLKALIG